MEKLLITGNGPLHGEVVIAGAKNAALPVLAASLLTSDPLQISNVPAVRDIATLIELMNVLGCKVDRQETELSIDTSQVHSVRAPYELVKTMRGSILLLGPLLARFGEADISLPGGCAIGSRPVNEHISGLQRMGADITIEGGYIKARATRLRGAHIPLDTPSVTATENLLMAAALADGSTEIENAAMEPEVTDLARLLVAMGANIKGVGSSHLTVEGTSRLRGTSHRVPPDRIESSMRYVLTKLEDSGAKLRHGADWVELDSGGRRCRAVNISTAPFPAFPTDMQAQFMALNALAEGTATVVENIFENRFMHVAELQRMGADISLQGHMAVVRGTERLQGAPVMATDLRASAALVIAALAADGETSIDRVYHLDRGYASIEKKLAGLGAIIRRV
jgi:UDP-N-acetylglucosamine 1-carboxyvinyltransferase